MSRKNLSTKPNAADEKSEGDDEEDGQDDVHEDHRKFRIQEQNSGVRREERPSNSRGALLIPSSPQRF